MSAKLYINYGRLPQMAPRVLKRGFNRLLDGPSFGISKAARRISQLARGKKVDFEVTELGITRLEERLRYLGALSIVFPENISPAGVRRILRDVLYQPVSQRFAEDFGLEFNSRVVPEAYARLRTLLEEKGRVEPFVKYLRRIFHRYRDLEAEVVARLLAIFPRSFIAEKEIVDRRDWLEMPKDQIRRHIHEIETHTIGHFGYTKTQLDLVRDYFKNMDEKKRMEVQAALTGLNAHLFHALQGVREASKKTIYPGSAS